MLTKKRVLLSFVLSFLYIAVGVGVYSSGTWIPALRASDQAVQDQRLNDIDRRLGDNKAAMQDLTQHMRALDAGQSLIREEVALYKGISIGVCSVLGLLQGLQTLGMMITSKKRG